MIKINKTVSDVTTNETNFKFVLVEIKIKDLVINVDLKTDEYNFYMIGNQFSNCFWQYVMTNFYYDQLKSIYSSSDLPFPEFLVHILDENVSELNIKSTDNSSILLMENNYKIVDLSDNDDVLIKDSEDEVDSERSEKEENQENDAEEEEEEEDEEEEEEEEEKKEGEENEEEEEKEEEKE